MTAEEREQMNSLCVHIQEEKDYRRFEALLRELNALIGRKEFRFLQSAGVAMPNQKRPCRTVSGLVQKIVKSIDPKRADSIEISIAEAEELFREVRIENKLTDADGQPVALKQGHTWMSPSKQIRLTTLETHEARASTYPYRPGDRTAEATQGGALAGFFIQD